MSSAAIYLITNLKNLKQYLGKACHPHARWLEHQNDAYRYQDTRPLYRAMRRDKIENFHFEVLGWFSSEDEAFEEEKRLISKLDLQNRSFGYNLSEGGRGGKGVKHTLQSRMNMSRVQRARKFRHAEETKKYLSEIGKGSRNSNFGRSWSEDRKQKSRDKQKGRNLTLDHREKLQLAKFGNCNAKGNHKCSICGSIDHNRRTCKENL